VAIIDRPGRAISRPQAEVEAVPKVRHGGRLLMEFVRFAKENKAYWIVPLVLVLGMTAFLIVAGQSAAPLIYALF
jgi:hypothetical protein